MRISAKQLNGEIVGVLDVGTSKVCCIIAVLGRQQGEASRRPARVIGFGHQQSRGLKAGTIVDLAQAEAAIRGAVAQAERTAGVMLEAVHLSVACGRLKSENFTASADVSGSGIDEDDLERLFAGGRAYAERDGRHLVHMERCSFQLDGSLSVRNPRGMSGRLLTADLVAVTVDEPALRNLLIVVDRCHLAPERFVPAPYASALAVLSSEERRLGALCIDIGAGTCMMAAFRDGRLLQVDGIAVGGNHITYDIARALSTPVVHAERIKTLCGTLGHASSDEHELVSYPLAEEAKDSEGQVSRAQLRHVIAHRAESLVMLLRERLDRSGVADLVGRRIVIAGGTGLLTGLADLVAAGLRAEVRIGTPEVITDMPDVMGSPVFATGIGLIAAATMPMEPVLGRDRWSGPASGLIERWKAWARESF